MKRSVTTNSQSRKALSPTRKRRSRDPIDPMPRVIERKKVKDAAQDSRPTSTGNSPSRKKPAPAKATARSARQVGSAIGSVLGKVVGKVEQTVAKVLPGRTAPKRRTASS